MVNHVHEGMGQRENRGSFERLSKAYEEGVKTCDALQSKIDGLKNRIEVLQGEMQALSSIVATIVIPNSLFALANSLPTTASPEEFAFAMKGVLASISEHTIWTQQMMTKQTKAQLQLIELTKKMSDLQLDLVLLVEQKGNKQNELLDLALEIASFSGLDKPDRETKGFKGNGAMGASPRVGGHREAVFVQTDQPAYFDQVPKAKQGDGIMLSDWQGNSGGSISTPWREGAARHSGQDRQQLLRMYS